jgi:hypothetical protein
LLEMLEKGSFPAIFQMSVDPFLILSHSLISQIPRRSAIIKDCPKTKKF